MTKQTKLTPPALLVPILLLLGLTACSSDRVDEVDSGGVVLSVSDFDGLPAQVSVNSSNAIGLLQVGEIEVQNLPKNPSAPTSSLQNVEISVYEVVYTRADSGTRLPPPFVRQIFSSVEVDGTVTFENLPVMSLEQLDATPLSDLLFVNGGFDSETGEQTILLNLQIRFFGETISGEEVSTQAAGFTVEFTP